MQNLHLCLDSERSAFNEVNDWALRFELDKPMTWLEAQDSCKTDILRNSYLVEILNEDQQLFIETVAGNYESGTGIRRDWWIGLTDEGYENR